MTDTNKIAVIGVMLVLVGLSVNQVINGNSAKSNQLFQTATALEASEGCSANVVGKYRDITAQFPNEKVVAQAKMKLANCDDQLQFNAMKEATRSAWNEMQDIDHELTNFDGDKSEYYSNVSNRYGQITLDNVDELLKNLIKDAIEVYMDGKQLYRAYEEDLQSKVDELQNNQELIRQLIEQHPDVPSDQEELVRTLINKELARIAAEELEEEYGERIRRFNERHAEMVSHDPIVGGKLTEKYKIEFIDRQ